jgi:hypothetical protein
MLLSLLRIVLVHVLVWGLVLAGFSSVAHGAIVSTQAVTQAEVREARLARVDAMLAQERVADAMVQLGVDPLDARLRAAALSDAELAELEGRLESLPAGGDALVILGIVFLVLLVLDLTGVINIFSRR